jgi:4-hydroxy-tetrahydrodipicolinate synthase
MMFSGSIPALVTPFRNGAIDEDALARLVEWQIASGSSALVPCGTTGESATLGFDEHYRVFDVVIGAAAGRVPVIAGCGSNDTATAIRHMARARVAGADAALVVAPYYNRPSQDGIVAHFEALGRTSDFPIIAYNVPSRTVTDILPETLARIVEKVPTVVSIKDASGDLSRVTRQAQLLGWGFPQLSGNDELWLAHALLGGQGCISVTANVDPDDCARLMRSINSGDWSGARNHHDHLFELSLAMFADASPAPAKYALSRLHDWFDPEVRLPLVPASVTARAVIDDVMTRMMLL